MLQISKDLPNNFITCAHSGVAVIDEPTFTHTGVVSHTVNTFSHALPQGSSVHILTIVVVSETFILIYTKKVSRVITFMDYLLKKQWTTSSQDFITFMDERQARIKILNLNLMKLKLIFWS